MIKQIIFGFLTCVMSNICMAGSADDFQLGGCGFAGPETLTNDYYCDSSTTKSEGIKKEAAIQLLSMAWNWVTGATPEAAAPQYLGAQMKGLNKGQKLEPDLRLKAHSDNLYLTVAYEF